MKPTDLVSLRRKAEEAVADMPDGSLKLKAFEVILANLLTSNSHAEKQPPSENPHKSVGEAPASLPGRIESLAEGGFFSEPRSLSEIQASLAQHGWHYPQNNLSTPLIRMVRQRQLRRLQVPDGKKKIWKYALP